MNKWSGLWTGLFCFWLFSFEDNIDQGCHVFRYVWSASVDKESLVQFGDSKNDFETSNLTDNTKYVVIPLPRGTLARDPCIQSLRWLVQPSMRPVVRFSLGHLAWVMIKYTRTLVCAVLSNQETLPLQWSEPLPQVTRKTWVPKVTFTCKLHLVPLYIKT